MTFLKASEKLLLTVLGHLKMKKKIYSFQPVSNLQLKCKFFNFFFILLNFQSAKNEIEKADSPSTSTSESFEELQTHEKQLPDKTRFNTRGLRAGYANRGTR